MSKLSDYSLLLCSSFSTIAVKLQEDGILSKGSFDILLIPNAADHDKINGSYPRRITEEIDELKVLGYNVHLTDLTLETEVSLKQKLFGMDAVMVGGGNTFWLLECMNRLGFTRLIKDYIDSGGIYISSSAGSCICSPDIEYVKFADDPTISQNTNYTSLNLINIAINPHFNGDKMPQSDVESFEYLFTHPGMPCITLSDQQAILCKQNGDFTVVSYAL